MESEKKLEKLYCMHKEGLPGVKENCPITMELDKENHLLIFKIRSIGKIYPEIKLSISKITKAGPIDIFNTKTKTTIKPKFAIGRSIIGGTIASSLSLNPFAAPVGAIVGAISSNKNIKKKSKNKKVETLFVINYVSDGTEKVIKLKECKNFNSFKFRKHLEDEIMSQHSIL